MCTACVSRLYAGCLRWLQSRRLRGSQLSTARPRLPLAFSQLTVASFMQFDDSRSPERMLALLAVYNPACYDLSSITTSTIHNSARARRHHRSPWSITSLFNSDTLAASSSQHKLLAPLQPERIRYPVSTFPSVLSSILPNPTSCDSARRQRLFITGMNPTLHDDTRNSGAGLTRSSRCNTRETGSDKTLAPMRLLSRGCHSGDDWLCWSCASRACKACLARVTAWMCYRRQ